MANRANDYPCYMRCPLAARFISVDDCLETQAAANRELLPSGIPAEYTANPDWRQTCMACKFFDD